MPVVLQIVVGRVAGRKGTATVGKAVSPRRRYPDQGPGLLVESGEVRDGVIDCGSVQATAWLSLCLARFWGSADEGRFAWRMVWAA